jgi:hypothetical protein
MALYFNSASLPPLAGEYIAWCDGMGMGQALGSSLERAANFIFKIHGAFSNALGHLPQGHAVRIYPLIDGMYVTTPNRRHFQQVLREALCELADEFVNTSHLLHRFIVRGGIAFGATIHGSDVHENAFVQGVGTPDEAVNRNDFRASHLNQTPSQLLLGAAMFPAYSAESLAPPFGFYVDDSALSIPQLVDPSDEGLDSKLWRWWFQNDPSEAMARRLSPVLQSHYAEAARRTREIGYPKESIQKHLDWAIEYFGGFQPPNP